MSATPSPAEIRRMIDEALEEIERTELEMLDLLAGVVGPDEARRVAEHIASTQHEHQLAKLQRDAQNAGRLDLTEA